MKIACLSVFSDDYNSGMPKWTYSLPFAYLQAHLTQSPVYGRLTFCHFQYYELADPAQIRSDLVAARPDVLAVSCYIWNIALVLQVVSSIKEQLPEVVIVLGGPQFDEDAGRLMDTHPAIDFIVVGEGEQTFRELIEHLVGHRGGPATDIDGLILQDESGRPVVTRPRAPRANIEEIPSPYLLGIVDPASLSNGLVGLETQRGCPNICGYCNYAKGFKKLRFFSTERVRQELELVLRHRPRQVYLMDPMFNSDRSRAKEVLRAFIELRDRLSPGTRVNTEMYPENLDEELLLLCRKARINVLELGVQSLNPRALAAMGRRRNEARLFENIRLALANKINVIPQFILGLPDDDVESFLATFDQIYALPVNDLQIFHLSVLPGTRFRREAARYGLVYSEQAPHFLLRSATFSEQDIRLLTTLRKLALALVPMKPVLGRVHEATQVPYHRLFMDFITRVEPHLLSFNWPLRDQADLGTAQAMLKAYGEHLLTTYPGKLDQAICSDIKFHLDVVAQTMDNFVATLGQN